jgi:hypothetical protein
MEILRRFLTFLINNIILVVAGVVIASKVARLYGLNLNYKRGIEELVPSFQLFIAWLW